MITLNTALRIIIILFLVMQKGGNMKSIKVMWLLAIVAILPFVNKPEFGWGVWILAVAILYMLVMDCIDAWWYKEVR